MSCQISQFRLGSHLTKTIPSFRERKFELLQKLLLEKEISLQLYLSKREYVFIFKAKEKQFEWNLFIIEVLPSLCNNEEDALNFVSNIALCFPQVIVPKDGKAIMKEIQDEEGTELIFECQPVSFLEQTSWLSNLRAVSWRDCLDWLQRLG